MENPRNLKLWPVLTFMGIIILALGGAVAFQYFDKSRSQQREEAEILDLRYALIKGLGDMQKVKLLEKEKNRSLVEVQALDPAFITQKLKNCLPQRIHRKTRFHFHPASQNRLSFVSVRYNKKTIYRIVFRGQKLPVQVDKDAMPQMALILDDAGMDNKLTEQYLSLDLALTFAVIPHLGGSHSFAQKARAKGYAVILHQPMAYERQERNYPPNQAGFDDKGLLISGMDKAQVERMLDSSFASVPLAGGMNNHMGSKATADPELMAHVMAYLKRKNYFFIDSLTSPKSVAFEQASRYGIPTARRDVFLDNKKALKPILKQLERTVSLAVKKGRALAIGHVNNRETLKALRVLEKKLKEKPVVRTVTVQEYLGLSHENAHFRH